jgi:hypothetical protein
MRPTASSGSRRTSMTSGIERGGSETWSTPFWKGGRGRQIDVGGGTVVGFQILKITMNWETEPRLWKPSR